MGASSIVGPPLAGGLRLMAYTAGLPVTYTADLLVWLAPDGGWSAYVACPRWRLTYLCGLPVTCTAGLLVWPARDLHG